MFYVYAYLRKKDLTPYYIGKGQGKRAYGKEHSVVVPRDLSRIVFLETNLTELGAFALERRYIKWYGRKDLGTGIIPWNYNKKVGSYLTDSSRKKISRANKGIPKNHGEKISATTTGKPKSAEHKAKLSASLKGSIPWNKGKTGVQESTRKGTTVSDETRAKMSAAHKGKANTDEQKAKISAKLKGRVMSEETRKKMSESRKKLWAEKKNARSSNE